ncbi:GH92 family glycosyl hydrolase [Streptomyces sp. NBC_00237]|uniref:GH92 family glycosyl hydrolase n=1 Tax=Streptomyces sp. NBC_00237 TaxID=2975687 RepID=UPI00224DEB62|nr:GH92 family glycosyl hydrolase [Streptomyces sp. NBC_00237]MCX5203539.1 GH92 family glycosyl hydrolase [Streptomyces sp. NBC_00237]
MQPRPRRTGTRRHRGTTAALACLAASALSVTLLAPSAAADPGKPGRPAPADRTFSSSFEAGEPAPAWRDTVETDSRGRKKSSGVDGGESPGIPGNVTDRVTDLRASAENAAGGEVKENLIDVTPGSKWLAFVSTGWVEFDLDAPTKVVTYALTSANDHAERDPKDWELQGSADGKAWTTLDTRKGETFASRFQTKTYDVTNDTAYQHYRLNITANGGAPILQLADVQFSNGDTSTPTPEDMRSQVDRGPSGSPTAKSGAGFTGKRALRYAGTHKPGGRAYSYNKVFDVNTRVGRDTELSYRVFPQLPAGEKGADLNYPATNVALDLAFTDGTYLSDLRALDQHGAVLSPQGQGASKTLYANQWNHKASRIGSVAAGKTIDRILVGYDNPKGPAEFRGWVDDVRIAEKAPEKRLDRLSDYALTTRGTQSSGSYSRGNNIPATAVPHGFNFWTPVTNAGSTSWLYDYARGNNADNLPQLQAFSASHEPSPWMGDRQTFQVMPSAVSGTPDATRTTRALPFRHENETAKPHYYGVTFENGLRTEMTPTDHAAMMRFTFPGDDASVIFDNVSNDGGLTLDPATSSFTGFSDVKSGLSTGATRLFVHGVFDAPVTASGKLSGGGGDDVTGYLRFKPSAQKQVTLRLATSLISVDQAKQNLASEIPAGSRFERIRDRAQDAWDRILGRVEVEGASHDQLTTLYSSLYRLYLYPNSGHEKVNGKTQYASPFSPQTGPDTPTRTGAKIVDGEVFVNNGFWDTYRTTWPAYSFLTPKTAGRLVDGFVQQYKDGGWISRWSSPGYADLMTGTSSDVAFADAYVKGVDFDASSAYEAALKNATVLPPFSGVGRKGMDTSPFRGYASTKTHEGLSWSLEGYLNDYGLAKMGEALYEKTKKPRYREESAYFLNRAQNYVKLFDSTAGFFQGRDLKGDWRVPSASYDPRIWGHDYTETNGWGYAFTAPQDSRGLANLYGGRSGLAGKLDAYFTTPETASPEFAGSYGSVIHEMTEARDVRMGMYGHSNQVAHHATYMYNAASQPWKTQSKVREVLSRLYTGSEIGQGYHGDEDNGEQSAWYLFSALGFYPLVMGSGEYAVGSPLFTRATVRLENGRTLTVRAPKNNAKNVYVQSLKVNGRAWNSTALPHDLLARGGTLDFAMGDRPSAWGSGRGAAPVSITRDDKVPTPRTDALTGATGPLFDDSSVTEAPLPPETTLPVTAPTRALQYTLTSSDRTKAPTGWTLEGSENGTTWKALDRRTDETFAWDRQTRVFTVSSPGTYRHYRLVTKGTSAVAELELLS